MKNTIIIFDQCGQEQIKFYVIQGDKSHLNKIYINESDTAEDKITELEELLYDENGNEKQQAKTYFPHADYHDAQTAVIVCGLLP